MRPWLLVAIVLTALVSGASWLVWENREDWLPNPVPTHWDMHGEPDRFTPREQMWSHLLIMPGTMVLMLVLGLLLPWLSPIRFKIEPFRPTYEYILMLVMLLFAYLSSIILASYLGFEIDLMTWLVGGCLILLTAIGNVLGKVKRNFYVGIRTPWTLASDQVWDRTHRVGAWLFVAGGLIGLALLVLGIPPLAALGIFLAAILIPVFYSLWLYKRLEREGRLGDQP